MKRQLEQIAKNLHRMSDAEIQKLYDQLSHLDAAAERDRCREDFLAFLKKTWSAPEAFIQGQHHKIVSEAFNRVVRGECKRLIINIAPRHGKSEMGSIHLPAWYLGHNPNRRVIQASHTAELAVGFGRRVRDMVQQTEYQEIFPGFALRADAKAAGRWTTVKGGQYFAIGVGGNVAGKGADLFIIDDSVSEQQALSGDPAVYDTVYQWFLTGPRQRLQPNAAIVVIETRWSQRDLSGRLISRMIKDDDVDKWEVIELPAILPSGKPLFPEYWKLADMLKLKAELPVGRWNAQYQQQPTAEEGALVKREWWKRWTGRPPECEFILQSWDCAQTNNETSDPSACTTWGVFRHPGPKGHDTPHIMLLDAFTERLEFPELKARAFKEYRHWKPDSVVIESKSAGTPLIYELRARGIPAQEYTPTRGNTKLVRVNAVADLFHSGMVWAPETRFADEVIEQFAAFPNGEYDDLVDSSTQALIRYRMGGFVRIHTDEDFEDDFVPRRADYY